MDCKTAAQWTLKGSFVPPERSRERRDLCRYKRKLIAQRVAQRNRMPKIQEDVNIKLSSVVSDVFDVTGTRIIEALYPESLNTGKRKNCA